MREDREEPNRPDLIHLLEPCSQHDSWDFYKESPQTWAQSQVQPTDTKGTGSLATSLQCQCTLLLLHLLLISEEKQENPPYVCTIQNTLLSNAGIEKEIIMKSEHPGNGEKKKKRPKHQNLECAGRDIKTLHTYRRKED